MQKTDAHQHFWKYDAETHGWITDEMKALRRDFVPADLKKELDRNGFDGCVAVQADQSEEETQFLLDLAAEHSFIKGVVGWLDIRAKNFEQRLEHFADQSALKGLRQIVQDEPDDRFLLQPDFMEGIGLLAGYDLTYDILIFEHQLPAAVEFAEQFPNQPFVLDHIGKPRIKEGKIDEWEEGIRALAGHSNMYCKLSGLVTEADWQQWKPDDFKPYLDVVFDAFGAERLMFGSDWPVCTLAASYGQVGALVEDYIHSLSQDQQSAIMGGNARRFYDL